MIKMKHLMKCSKCSMVLDETIDNIEDNICINCDNNHISINDKPINNHTSKIKSKVKENIRKMKTYN